MRLKTLLSLAAFGVLSATGVSAQAPALKCTPMRPDSTLAARPSKYDSLKIAVGKRAALLCYGRPAAKGRTMIGGTAVPFGKLWRTGANEPTILHLPFAAMIAGIHVVPGSYSIYTVPGKKEWEVIVNKSITQWGHESRYTDEIKAQEVGRGKIKPESLRDHVEVLVFKTQPKGKGAQLLLEWEKIRLRIPVAPM